MLKLQVKEERGRAQTAETELESARVQHDVNTSKILASIQSMVATAVADKEADHDSQLQALTAQMSDEAVQYKSTVARLKREVRKYEGAALRRELEIGRILDDTQAVANEAAAAASTAQEEAATARADAKAADARAAQLEEEMLVGCPSLLGACRVLSVPPTSPRLTAGTGTRPGSSASTERATSLLAINATNCIVKVGS